MATYAHWLLRIAVASVFLFHGYGKVMDVGAFAGMMGFSVTVAWLVTLAELGGGVLILVGGVMKDGDGPLGGSLATRAGAAMMAIVALGAIVLAHWPQWSFVPSESHPMGGMEFQVTLLLISLYFLIVGNSKN
ncbi:MAG: DoxX family protein [Gammaproteobacteria bacterium]|nr:MAG: DoxX family protein [Gammaproteobacteria bacterium]